MSRLGLLGLQYLAAQLGDAPHYSHFLEEVRPWRPRTLEDTMSYYKIRFITYGKKISSIDP